MSRFVLLCLLLAGCSGTPSPNDQAKDDAIAAERAKLAPEDQSLVAAQEWCVVSTKQRLGSMGPPVKLNIHDQPVFLCCKSCAAKAEGNPEKTLATLKELREKAKP
jgi:hypothetical protein